MIKLQCCSFRLTISWWRWSLVRRHGKMCRRGIISGWAHGIHRSKRVAKVAPAVLGSRKHTFVLVMLRRIPCPNGRVGRVRHAGWDLLLLQLHEGRLADHLLLQPVHGYPTSVARCAWSGERDRVDEPPVIRRGEESRWIVCPSSRRQRMVKKKKTPARKQTTGQKCRRLWHAADDDDDTSLAQATGAANGSVGLPSLDFDPLWTEVLGTWQPLKNLQKSGQHIREQSKQQQITTNVSISIFLLLSTAALSLQLTSAFSCLKTLFT